jgi:hypothetical protein
MHIFSEACQIPSNPDLFRRLESGLQAPRARQNGEPTHSGGKGKATALYNLLHLRKPEVLSEGIAPDVSVASVETMFRSDGSSQAVAVIPGAACTIIVLTIIGIVLESSGVWQGLKVAPSAMCSENMLWIASRIEQQPTRRQRLVARHLVCLDEYTPSFWNTRTNLSCSKTSCSELSRSNDAPHHSRSIRHATQDAAQGFDILSCT